MNVSDIAVLNIHGADYCCIISRISESEAIKLINIVDFSEKEWSIIICKTYKIFLKHV